MRGMGADQWIRLERVRNVDGFDRYASTCPWDAEQILRMMIVVCSKPATHQLMEREVNGEYGVDHCSAST